MFDELVKSALVLLVSFALKWFFALINFEIDLAVFNALVGAIVLYFLTLLGYEGARKLAPKSFR
jgi:hypothetical protein